MTNITLTNITKYLDNDTIQFGRMFF